MFKCFVICPFGNKSRGEEEARLLSEITAMQKNVFRRAEKICKKNNIDVRIEDARLTPSTDPKILESTQRGIDNADAVIVILTADKPNVYLELGWAHAMWQSPILLMREGYSVASDITDMRGIPFTAAQVTGEDKAGTADLAHKLALQVADRIALGKRQRPFAHWPETTLARGEVHVYNRFSKGISKDEWSSMMRVAKEEIILASTGMSKISGQEFSWHRDNKPPLSISLPDFLLLKAQEGVAVTVIMYHESNMTLGQMKRLERGKLDLIRAEIRNSFELWSQTRLNYENTRRNAEAKLQPGESLPPPGRFRVVQLLDRHLPYRMTVTESRAIITARFYTEAYNSGLCIDARAPEVADDPHNKSVYSQVRDELQFLIDNDEESSETFYKEWLEARG